MNKVRQIIDHLVFNRINIYKTLLMNFANLPFKEACKLPIWVRGKCKIAHLGQGKIIIKGQIKTGMIGIGNSDPVRSFYSKSFLDVQGTLEMEEGVILRRGINLSIASFAKLALDKNVIIGDNSTIISWDSIHIQSYTRIGNNLLMMDTDFHYVMNRETRMIKANHAPIVIGENNWIGGWCVVKKGTQTPKGTIVAGPYSMIGKNYVGKIPEYSMLAGSPAKLIMEGVQRVENVRTENMLKVFFKTHDESFIVSDKMNIDNFCMA
ncbi:hypothetical protein HCG92_12600 [Bacteroides cellulosilyticus]|jgi:hypothetical protein|uniref:hypothetical protein n=2 Tax=Bacteroides cellulosilyticus TaxID=246787 RepID=UPI00189FD40D|nr:hypothetical protein [Bacteroides cellulosilyticus]MBX9086070.1 hypothetical protein [Bacteroides cellulosilyticus]